MTQLPMKLETPTETIVHERKTKERPGSVSRYETDHFKGHFRKTSPALATTQNRPQAQKHRRHEAKLNVAACYTLGLPVVLISGNNKRVQRQGRQAWENNALIYMATPQQPHILPATNLQHAGEEESNHM